ncbi:hypothetical protein GCM10022251_46740 [Phytohabitans flavus]
MRPWWLPNSIDSRITATTNAEMREALRLPGLRWSGEVTGSLPATFGSFPSIRSRPKSGMGENGAPRRDLATRPVASVRNLTATSNRVEVVRCE